VSDSFGHIFDADLLEDAVRNQLKLWLPTYLLELELQRGLAPNSLERPRSFLVAEEVDREMGDQLPSVIVVSPGLVDRPILEGGSLYRARWHVAAGVMVEAGGADPRAATKRMMRRYQAAVRACLLQKRGVLPYVDEDSPQVSDVAWVDESYDRLDFEAGQTIAAGESVFEFEITHVTNRNGGPAFPAVPDPPAQVGADWPTVQSTQVEVDPVPITEEV